MTFNGQPVRIIPWLITIDDARVFNGIRVLVQCGDKELDVTSRLTQNQFWEAYTEFTKEVLDAVG